MSHYTFEQFDDASFKGDQQQDLVDWSVGVMENMALIRLTFWMRSLQSGAVGPRTYGNPSAKKITGHKTPPENIYLNSFPENHFQNHEG